MIDRNRRDGYQARVRQKIYPIFTIAAALIFAAGCELKTDSIEFNPAVNVNSDQTTTTVTIVTNQPSTNVASEASSK